MTKLKNLTPSKALPANERLASQDVNMRQVWATNRFCMESHNMKTKRYGGKGHHHWLALLWMMKAFQFSLKITRQYDVGVRNARDILFRQISIVLPDLPKAFHGFTILQLSDLHLDGMPGLEQILLELITGRRFDICVLTGDYRTELHGPTDKVMQSLQVLLEGINSENGILGILGNHDDMLMVAPMEAMGIHMLINENLIIEKNGAQLQFIGTDDVHYYYTDMALHALKKASGLTTIALVHSAELYQSAADYGVDLYLCGHTHAGQVCLPWGTPIMTHLNRGKQYFRGQWRYKNMQGITNAGAGTSGIPVRFYTRGEVLSIKLLCHE
ncbi:MAG: metallophosphoesterase [Thiohalomonadales bacterium]